MRKQIVRLSIHQTSKVIAAMHAVMLTVLFILPNTLAFAYNGHFFSALMLLIFMPLFIWALMYVGYIVACWFYNLVTPWMGGIELDVEDVTSVGPILPLNKHLVEEDRIDPIS